MSTNDTAASEHGADAETTFVPPPAADEPDLAWSTDDDSCEASPDRHGRLIWAALAVLVVAVTAALVLLVSTFFAHRNANTAKPQPIPPWPPLTSSSAAALTPASPPAATPSPNVFVVDTQRRGYFPDKSDAWLVGRGEWVCGNLDNGADPDGIAVLVANNNPSMHLDTAMGFVQLSIKDLCPLHLAEVTSWPMPQ